MCLVETFTFKSTQPAVILFSIESYLISNFHFIFFLFFPNQSTISNRIRAPCEDARAERIETGAKQKRAKRKKNKQTKKRTTRRRRTRRTRSLEPHHPPPPPKKKNQINKLVVRPKWSRRDWHGETPAIVIEKWQINVQISSTRDETLVR